MTEDSILIKHSSRRIRYILESPPTTSLSLTSRLLESPCIPPLSQGQSYRRILTRPHKHKPVYFVLAANFIPFSSPIEQ